jgi:hypothetical protein
VSVLHITNGSHAGDKLKTFADGPVAITADVLHEGPCPPVDGDAWYELRARELSAGGGCNHDEVRAGLAASDRTIADAVTRGEPIVLWFEHDLFDQLLIIRTLDLIGRLTPDTTKRDVSLICIDRFPGVDRFIGLGQLTPAELATLRGTAVPVDDGHFAIAAAAWAAFRSPDPRDLLAIVARLQTDADAVRGLPFLRAALLRFLAEYPSSTNGLSWTEALALDALNGGTATMGELFQATQRQEPHPFMGDSTFYDIMRRLASYRVPLVAFEAGPQNPGANRVAITDAGRDVLAGRSDHVRLNGIDRGRGGVHLAGSDFSPWRWDAHIKTLVS